jgi:hypothetical protein
VSISKPRGGGVLIAVFSKSRSCKRKYDLQYYDECVWVEIPTQNGLSLLVGSHYFSPDTKVDIILQYYSFLENNLDTQNHNGVLVGDFNIPNFDREGHAFTNLSLLIQVKG